MSVTAQRLTVSRASGSCGAEVSGLDLAAPLDPRTVADLRAIWLEHGVLFLREANLPPARFLEFAGLFGTPVEYPFVRGLDGFPQITPVIKEPHERINFGGVWHSDTAYLERPPMATMLIAREVPPAGGDTIFASTRRAYAALSEPMKAFLRGKRAIHDFATARKGGFRNEAVTSDQLDALPPMPQPLVRQHLDSGEPCLFTHRPGAEQAGTNDPQTGCGG